MAQVATMFNTPPPTFNNQNSNIGHQPQFQPLQFKPFQPPDGDYDGKRLRKSVMRKTVDYNSSVIQMLENRIWQRDERDRPALPPDICYASHILPPPAYLTNPINAVVTKFVRSSTNKAKCPIFCLAWTPEGRRLITGASSGEFTLWNGLTFNFETILQAHESSVRAMVWSHNDQWMVTGDTSGFVKYWQSNMNNVKMFQAHKDPVRGLSFSPSDLKLATGSDDGTVRIWDFYRCTEEKVLIGHGSDVKCVDWHPSKSLLASGSKDNQQPIKLWDPRTGTSLAQLHAHKSTVMDLKWNSNGVWLCSASRDHLLKLFDIRNFSTELQIFRGHKKEAASIAWHPQYEGLFSSGGSDGSILFWHVGNDKEVGAIESAHDGIIWDLAWHPLGHLLCSGSNDHSSKFWTRNRPGDKMRDKYNLNTLPPGVVGDDCVDIDDIPMTPSISASAVSAIPGMGPEDKVDAEAEVKAPETIPGLEFDSLSFEKILKKTPYAKPIPKTFQVAWNATVTPDDTPDNNNQSLINWVIVQVEKLFKPVARGDGPPIITENGEELPPGSVPLSQIKADAIAYYGFYIPLMGKVQGDKIQDAFAFLEEEEALAEVTMDSDFARKLVREKKELYSPNPSQSGDSKNEKDHKKEVHYQRQNDSNAPQKYSPASKQPLLQPPPSQDQNHPNQPPFFRPNDQRNNFNSMPNTWDRPPHDRFPQREFENKMGPPNYYNNQRDPPLHHSGPPDHRGPSPPFHHQRPYSQPMRGRGRRDFRRNDNEDSFGDRSQQHGPPQQNFNQNHREDERYDYGRDNHFGNRPPAPPRDDGSYYWGDDQQNGESGYEQNEPPPRGQWNEGDFMPQNQSFKRSRPREPEDEYQRRDGDWQDHYDENRRRPPRRGVRGGGGGGAGGGRSRAKGIQGAGGRRGGWSDRPARRNHNNY